MSRMIHVYNVWFAFKSYKQRNKEKNKEWMDANPDLYATILSVRKLRESNA